MRWYADMREGWWGNGGTFGSGTLERMTGQVGRCIVRSGFAGTVVADFDSSLAGPTGYTDAYGNVWTIS